MQLKDFFLNVFRPPSNATAFIDTLLNRKLVGKNSINMQNFSIKIGRTKGPKERDNFAICTIRITSKTTRTWTLEREETKTRSRRRTHSNRRQFMWQSAPFSLHCIATNVRQQKINKKPSKKSKKWSNNKTEMASNKKGIKKLQNIIIMKKV